MTDPKSGKMLSEVYKVAPYPDGMLQPLGSGSDYTTFIHHLGVPSVDWGFISNFSGAPYHSAFDDLDWMDRFGSFNGTYDYYVTMAQLIGSVAIEISSEKVTFNMTLTSNSLESYFEDFRTLVANSTLSGVNLAQLQDAVVAFQSAVKAGQFSPAQTLDLERQFLYSPGLPLRPFYKHLIQAPGLNLGYGSLTFPGPTQSILDGNVTSCNEQIVNLAQVINSAAAYLN